MVLGLVIAFEYRHHPLPSVYHDIARATTFLTHIEAQVHLLSDVVLSETELALEGVTGGMPSFHRVTSYLDLVLLLPLIVDAKERHMIVYFSGHGEQESMLFPGGDLFPFLTLRDQLLKLIDPQGQLLFILDCCYPGSMNLPLILDHDRLKLTRTPKDFLTHQVLILTSAQRMERAVATRNGSLFTSYLFKYLENVIRKGADMTADDAWTSSALTMSNVSSICSRSWITLIASLNKSIVDDQVNQRVALYSSHDTPLVLWGWINRPQKYQVVASIDHHTLKLERFGTEGADGTEGATATTVK